MPDPVPEPYIVRPTPYPAQTRTATTPIKNIPTTATCSSFADKIVVTVSQNGRLGHWVRLHSPLTFRDLHALPFYGGIVESKPLTRSTQVHVPLDIAATDHTLTTQPYTPDTEHPDPDVPSSDLLPMHHLTATTILGGTLPLLDTLGQTLATQIASLIMTRNPAEKRMVVVGLGLDREMAEASGREEFGELVGLVMGVL